MQTVPTGELVVDRFRIVRFIAEGGMGEVYEAEDTVLGDRVALKFLSRRSIGDEHVMRRFRREIQLARKVTHRNVCRLHDLAQHTPTSGVLAGREVTFVTMELLEGETLEDYLAREGRFEEEQALPLILQMAEALTAAHAAGVIHRDFKTSNVMLVPNSASASLRGDEADDTGLRVVVTDFGLARPTVRDPADTRTPLTGETRIVGTADYMSPEQLYGEEVSPASDVYALGVVIFEMMTGNKPYTASNPMALLAKRVSEPPASPRDFIPDLDPHVTSVILDCLKTDPAERLATARDVIVALAGEDAVFAGGSSGTLRGPPKGGQRNRVTGVLREQAAKRNRGAQTPDRATGAQTSGPGKHWNGGWIAAAVVLAALAGLAFWGRLGNPPSPNVLNRFNPVQLTTSAGLELDPTFAPDGDALAYSSDQGGTFEIYVRDLTPGGREIQLTDDGGQNFEPAWSPDGKTLAYHSRKRGGIWLIPATGGASPDGAPPAPPKPLTRIGSRPAWSPDGKTLAFQSESSPQVSDTASPALALSTLWRVAVDGTERRQLTRAGQPAGGHAAPAFSPDGRRIAFSTSPQRETSEIWSVGIQGDDPIRMSSEPSTSSDPAYAADGRSIYFSARSREVNALWQLPVSPRSGKPNGPAVQIKNLGLASIRQLATSADGSKMAYAAIKTITNLWALPITSDFQAAGEPVPLTHGTGRNNRPAFSPDGRRIAFDRWQHGLDVAIWTMSSDGAEMRQLTVDAGSQTQPSWLPSGQRVGFQARAERRRIFASIDLDSSSTENLAELDADVDWARLSPDGTRLAFHSRGEGLGVNLWLLDLADGNRRQLTDVDEFMGFPCWSPDGQWLAFQNKEGEDSHLMVVPAAGGQPRRLTVSAGQNWPFSFSPDSERIAFAALRDGEWNLWWISRLTGEQRRLTESPRLNTYVRYPAWSPAGDRIVYELAETTGDIWLLSD